MLVMLNREENDELVVDRQIPQNVVVVVVVIVAVESLPFTA